MLVRFTLRIYMLVWFTLRICLIVRFTLTNWRLNCWSPSLSAVLFPIVADPSTLEQWRVPFPLAKRVAELVSPCCSYAEVSRVLLTLNSPICVWKGKTHRHIYPCMNKYFCTFPAHAPITFLTVRGRVLSQTLTIRRLSGCHFSIAFI